VQSLRRHRRSVSLEGAGSSFSTAGLPSPPATATTSPAVEHAIDHQRPVLSQLGDQIRQPSQAPVQAVVLRLTRDDRRDLDHGIAHTAHANHPRNYPAPVPQRGEPSSEVGSNSAPFEPV
jgi:hypothetical protein